MAFIPPGLAKWRQNPENLAVNDIMENNGKNSLYGL
jgi:hypothetical protein